MAESAAEAVAAAAPGASIPPRTRRPKRIDAWVLLLDPSEFSNYTLISLVQLAPPPPPPHSTLPLPLALISCLPRFPLVLPFLPMPPFPSCSSSPACPFSRISLVLRFPLMPRFPLVLRFPLMPRFPLVLRFPLMPPLPSRAPLPPYAPLPPRDPLPPYDPIPPRAAFSYPFAPGPPPPPPPPPPPQAPVPAPPSDQSNSNGTDNKSNGGGRDMEKGGEEEKIRQMVREASSAAAAQNASERKEGSQGNGAADGYHGFDHGNYLGEGGFGRIYRGRLKDGQEVAVKRLTRPPTPSSLPPSFLPLPPSFDHANYLGEGGFGRVYRGRLKNGQDVAVKRLTRLRMTGSGSTPSAHPLFPSSFPHPCSSFDHGNYLREGGFDHANYLGEGGFGRVYRGRLKNGQEVAVKRLTRLRMTGSGRAKGGGGGGGQGEREFVVEVEMLSRLHHRNLVKLIGYCASHHHQLLCYELVPNGSLEAWLHGYVSLHGGWVGTLPSLAEFVVEEEMLSCLHHCNLVKLIGYCPMLPPIASIPSHSLPSSPIPSHPLPSPPIPPPPPPTPSHPLPSHRWQRGAWPIDTRTHSPPRFTATSTPPTSSQRTTFTPTSLLALLLSLPCCHRIPPLHLPSPPPSLPSTSPPSRLFLLRDCAGLGNTRSFSKEIVLDWATRMRVALGAARGLAYLHEDSQPLAIHCGLKSSLAPPLPSPPLLFFPHQAPSPRRSYVAPEYAMTGHLVVASDVYSYGVALLEPLTGRKPVDMSQPLPHSHRLFHSCPCPSPFLPGIYVAPEYAMTGHLVVASDVYSYGVVLLELLTGRKPVDMSQPPGDENLVTWARPRLGNAGRLDELLDPKIASQVRRSQVSPSDLEQAAAVAQACVSLSDLEQAAAVAQACVAAEPTDRPPMGEVVQSLKRLEALAGVWQAAEPTDCPPMGEVVQLLKRLEALEHSTLTTDNSPYGSLLLSNQPLPYDTYNPPDSSNTLFETSQTSNQPVLYDTYDPHDRSNELAEDVPAATLSSEDGNEGGNKGDEYDNYASADAAAAAAPAANS
ncbi:unnamed protein product [Closterium sp. NIES-64]|nr:unnamed protein product [Closterium sp. NIES-64]